MKDVSENDRFSAYVDGELTADEQARVEELLATSPEARQLVDELRAVRGTLESLPAQRVGEDLGPEILRRAEREMFTKPAPGQPRLAEAPAELPRWRAVLGRVLRPRALAWPGVAVAASILIFLLGPSNPEPPDGRTIALEETEDVSAARSAPEVRSAPEITASQPVEFAFSEVDDAEGGRAAPRMGKAGPVDSAAEDLESPAFPSKAGVLSDRGESPKESHRSLAKPSAKRASRGDSLKDSSQDAMPAESPSPPSGGSAGSNDAESLIVVECDVTGDAMRRQVFNQLLDDRQIRLGEHATSQLVQMGMQQGRMMVRRRQVAAQPQEVAQPLPAAESEEAVEGVVRGVAGGQKVGDSLQQVAESLSANQIQVEVEVSGEQVRALLGDLIARPKEFPAVGYVSLPASLSLPRQAPSDEGRRFEPTDAMQQEAPPPFSSGRSQLGAAPVSPTKISKSEDLEPASKVNRAPGKAKRGVQLELAQPSKPLPSVQPRAVEAAVAGESSRRFGRETLQNYRMRVVMQVVDVEGVDVAISAPAEEMPVDAAMQADLAEPMAAEAMAAEPVADEPAPASVPEP